MPRQLTARSRRVVSGDALYVRLLRVRDGNAVLGHVPLPPLPLLPLPHLHVKLARKHGKLLSSSGHWACQRRTAGSHVGKEKKCASSEPVKMASWQAGKAAGKCVRPV